ncbi:hypothetical protein LX36DRAFT_388128 [Colletotrichum falcatum]|nr:hypothetical protein LX36DRAFT_388128 [Colletotrichum falcatum]
MSWRSMPSSRKRRSPPPGGGEGTFAPAMHPIHTPIHLGISVPVTLSSAGGGFVLVGEQVKAMAGDGEVMLWFRRVGWMGIARGGIPHNNRYTRYNTHTHTHTHTHMHTCAAAGGMRLGGDGLFLLLLSLASGLSGLFGGQSACPQCVRGTGLQNATY